MRERSERDREIAGLIAARAARAGVELADDRLSTLSAYIGLLTKWNRRLNLTALSLEPLSDEAIDRLLIEPVVAARNIREADKRAIDIGSGGGSPAIPLKVMAPWISMVLVESRARKAAFLREAVRELGLAGVVVENARFEELAPQRFAGIDLASIRAVRADLVMWEQVASILAPGARVFWFRGSGPLESHLTGSGRNLVLAGLYPLGASGEVAILSKAG